jgi:tRNA threonylcarbamoyladenosine biosynthesis protein TsaB
MSEMSFDNLLAIETSTSRLKLGLSFGGDRLVKSDDEVERSHGQIIVRKISNLFSSAGLQPGDLNGIVVSTGPGSFTGLRIGLAAAKGMAVALKIPIVGVSLFELAAQVLRYEEHLVWVVLRVRRDEFLVGQVLHGTFDPGAVAAVPAAQLGEYIHEGEAIGVGLDLSIVAPGANLVDGIGELDVDPTGLIEIGRRKLEAGEGADVATLEPLYLQKSQAEIKFEQRHRQP